VITQSQNILRNNKQVSCLCSWLLPLTKYLQFFKSETKVWVPEMGACLRTGVLLIFLVVKHAFIVVKVKLLDFWLCVLLDLFEFV
jgi:hypothetical protein